MKIKDAAIKVMECVNDKPIRQTELVTKIVELTGYSYESCRCNVFRNVNFCPFISTDFIKVKDINNRTCYIRGKNTYRQEYNKPSEYYEFLTHLTSNKVYTLSGTESHCSSIIPNIIKVDKSPLTNPDIKGDIFKIKIDGDINLDFEGILTIGKVNKINKLNSETILLTIRYSKSMNKLLRLLKYKAIKEFTYKSRKNTMCISLLKLSI